MSFNDGLGHLWDPKYRAEMNARDSQLEIYEEKQLSYYEPKEQYHLILQINTDNSSCYKRKFPYDYADTIEVLPTLPKIKRSNKDEEAMDI